MIKLATSLAAVVLATTAAIAQNPAEEETRIPQRVVVVSGDTSKMHKDVVAVIYDSNDLHFHDPSAPRFLFLDRKGKIALGIGGYVYATAAYNWAGTENSGTDFVPSTLPTPADPDQRAALQFTARHSTIFLQLAGYSERFGTYSAFVQTDFTGGSGNAHQLKLSQAYFRIGYVTMGLARSTFVDAAGIATVDTQGPCGALDNKNVHISYAPHITRNWSVAIGVEAPLTGITTGDFTHRISQRVPDIPVYVQYCWGNNNHIRASALLRNLCYRDIVADNTRYTTGYGVQLSGTSALGAGFSLYADAIYGRGLGSYVADMKPLNVDLIPSASTPGKLIAPRSFSYGVGLRYDFCAKGFATLAWGQATLYDRGSMGSDTYRSGTYFSANAFYNLFEDCLLGIEYARGDRKNFDGTRGCGNRVMAAIRYSF